MEIIVGEPLREAHRLGVPVPTLTIVYSLLKALQARTKQRKGMVPMPVRKGDGAGDMVVKFDSATT